MRRHLPEVALDWQKLQLPRREAIDVELQLITPMFGGGYKPREVDLLMPIRPAAIRGHLRFWWRATAGAQYKNAEQLYNAEAAIWGGAATPENKASGKVAIQVTILDEGRAVPYAAVAPRATPREGPLHGFFLFPFQPQRDTPAAVGREGTTFRLRLLLEDGLTPQQKLEVRNALKAWIAFGGVGARTRRGCGALQPIGSSAYEWLLPAKLQELRAWLNSLLPNSTAEEITHTLPSLWHARVVLVEPKNDARAVWRELGRFWARFRKGHFPEPYQPMRGGKWADYRRVLCRLRQQGTSLKLAKPHIGLPIIYQQIRRAQLCFTGRIEPVNSGRMASPVIIKPVALSDGQIAGLIAVLHAQAPQAVKINNQRYTLSEPPKSDEPVLEALSVSAVLDAVVKAAQLHFKMNQQDAVITIGCS